MTTRDTPFAPGTPCWVDLLSSDVEKAKAFYGGILGWTNVDGGPDFGGYVNFFSDGHGVAGMMENANPSEMGPDRWNTYISTDNIDATTASASAAGAQVISPPMEVMDLGSMAILQDPAGGMFGLWQPGKHTGFQKYNEPGSVTWDEFHSKNYAASTSFYTTVFGWKLDVMSDADDFRYSTGTVNGEAVAGMMDSSGFLPAEVPSHWAVYFAVANTDAAVAQAVELGGTVVRAAEDTPFGRVADMVDPTGAAFRLLQAPAEAG
ncbi:hypothetical protein SAMN05892883_1333 [Jatrophihabitans sp. GAS493]|uniref:VOC family protein n=1 Tax=Jatrophihabitans sp. GAS493 TaxID=1907575 RepID=UPI000BB97239|nr:VOC family protein [Jatrophihabitans sp. GAS493]SOD71872.1 hypothetical protein SAMN05892883_1333 [Jatrophihabitans sp. GAS493]